MLAAHKTTLQSQIGSTDDEGLKETLQEELQLLDEAVSAPSKPFVRNYERKTDTEEVHDKGRPIQGLSLQN